MAAEGRLPMAKSKARTFGQDLMRGEHVVGEVSADRSALPQGLLFGEIDNFDGAGRTITGTSIFDPVLCELVYRWFCPPAGLILDPFAGGSVRGIVAAKLGRRYIGIDLREEQTAANRIQGEQICGDDRPGWITGDSIDVIAELSGDHAHVDMIFSCPPYGDLERYSDDDRDLSTMEFPFFMIKYREIIKAACDRLKDDRFACFVVGDFRDKKGFYQNFPGRTIEAFENAGLRLYNEAILVTAAGSLPVRVRRQFETARKLGKTHQNVYVFCKGDPKKASEAVGAVDFGEVEGVDGQGEIL